MLRDAGCYSTLPYFCAKLVCDLIPLRVIPPIAFSCIVYFMIGLNNHTGRLLVFIGVVIIINLAASGVCYVLASLTGSVQQANLLTSLVFVFNVLFAGAFLTARNAIVDAIMTVSLFNWAWKVSS